MTAQVTSTNSSELRFAALWPFPLITFGLAWGLMALFMVFPEHMTLWFGAISGRHPLFLLAVHGDCSAGPAEEGACLNHSPFKLSTVVAALSGGGPGWPELR